MIKAGEVLRGLVDESGRTNTEIAAELGMSRQSLHQYLNRDPDKIRVDTFQRILDALGYEIKIMRKEP